MFYLVACILLQAFLAADGQCIRGGIAEFTLREFNATETKAFEGVCPSFCLAVYDPYCGTDGKTYSSLCHLEVARCQNKSIDVAFSGKCKKCLPSSNITYEVALKKSRTIGSVTISSGMLLTDQITYSYDRKRWLTYRGSIFTVANAIEFVPPIFLKYLTIPLAASARIKNCFNASISTCNEEISPSVTLASTADASFRDGINFTCTVQGQPYAVISWQTAAGFKFSANDAVNNFDSNGDVHKSVLLLTKIRLSAAGFRCKQRPPPCFTVMCIANYPGSNTTQSSSRKIDVYPSSPISFKVQTMRPKSVTSHWRRPVEDTIMNYTGFGLALTSMSGPRRDNLPISDSQALDFSHTISGLNPCTYYNMELSARNYIGESVWVKHNFTTSAGLLGISLNYTDVSSATVGLQWKLQEQFGKCEINNASKFVIRYKCLRGYADLTVCNNTLQTEVNDSYRAAVVRNLNPATSYQVQIIALTRRADLNFTSQLITFETKSALPIGVPINVTVSPVNISAIMITWEDLKMERKNGKIEYFILTVFKTDTNAPNSSFNYTETAREATITELQECTKYTLALSGCNAEGCGPSVNNTVRTFEKMINNTGALSLKMDERNPGNFSVVAAVVGDLSTEKCLTGYVVEFKGQDEGNWTATGKIVTNSTTRIYSLRPYTNYQFRSRLVGFTTVGPWSGIKQLKTGEGLPGAVHNLKFGVSSPSSGNLTWDALLQPNGVIIAYIITILGSRSYDVNFRHYFKLNMSDAVTQANISGLFPGTTYIITVKGMNSKYEGLPSTISHVTEALRPLQPEPLALDLSTIIQSSIRVTAKSVHADRGPITLYQVIVLQRVRYTDTLPSDISNTLFNYDKAKAVGLDYYLALNVRPFNGTKTFYVGDSRTFNVDPGTFNAPLNKRLNYTIYLRAESTWNKKVLYSSASATLVNRYPINLSPVAASGIQSPTTIRIQLIAIEPLVKYVRVVIQKIDVSTALSHPDQYSESNITTYSVSKQANFVIPYVTAELSGSYFTQFRDFVIGNGNRTSRTGNRRRRNSPATNVTIFYNGPLDPGSSYAIFFRAFHSDIVYFSSEWSKPISTSIRPVSELEPKASEAGIIAGIVLCVLAVPFFVILGIILWKRHKKAFEAKYRFSTMELVTNGRSHNANGKGAENPTYFDDVFVSEGSNGNVNMSDFVLDYPIDVSHPPVPISNFPDYMEHLKERDYAFEDEFLELNSDTTEKKSASKAPNNKTLNRDIESVPFDHARVVLQPHGKKETDYINAAFVDNYYSKNSYIATQAPLSDGISHFWDMIWQQNVHTIVMIMHDLDDDKTDTPIYWPVNKPLDFHDGQMIIKLEDKIIDDTFTVRRFTINVKDSPQRTIQHFHFQKWPQRGVPSSLKDLLQFRDRINQWQKGKHGPQVIHCSDGSGRTGTYIALDAILKNIRPSKAVDIFNFINFLRSRRTNMVGNDRQYEFIHDAVHEVLTRVEQNTEMTWANARELHRSLNNVDSLTGCRGFTKLFKHLNRGVKSVSNAMKNLEGSKAINDYKNRYSFKVPKDIYRVRLPIFGSTTSNTDDYINATFVSLSDQSRFITTQAPFGITVNDFWTMVHFSRSDVIITLNSLEEGSVSFSQYWPSDDVSTATYGNFKVTFELETTPFPCVIQRDFTFSELGHPEITKEVTQFHVIGWEDHDIPSSRTSILQLAAHIAEEYMAEDKPTIIVQCSDGYGRSGTFCACVEAIKKLLDNGIVDIYSIVRKFRTRNMSYVENETQFKFIFDIAVDFVEQRK